MHLRLALSLLPLTTHAINIISSNDDGWAEINIRTFYDSLTAAGHSVVISAPAENESGTGSDDATPTNLTEACEFNSCPSGSPAYGYNASEPRWNYVNSYPVTSIKYGINTLSEKFFSGSPALAVTGPNVGANLGLSVFFSGTVGAATYAAKQGIPAIAFSGSTGSQTAWNVSVPTYSTVYAELSTKLADALVASGTPYLPDDIWLNVNFGAVSDSSCTSADDFKFVLSRIFTAIPLISGDDVETCDNDKRLPTETKVVDSDGCYASVSVGTASDKLDANSTIQGVVLEKLSGLLTCLD
ncbi:5'/3'-nucleotidase SurE [Aspergillus ibericus CBS 121593]|uniref:Sure-like protein n=1 Tax=Aspergillus ibericus CBS 121593 TaxID=1448316 RepID=A0A395GKZ3_9EURO|nr:sure-like protein [Aspergillus ibericus CBS 121593]RAK96054.1 sure-like protein [Aspergillus ibericus CBS 121593]